MADENFQKAGRGGAGNFHKKNVESKLRQDVEAQRSSDAPLTIERPGQPSSYQRSGRGGAGNFVAAEELPLTSSGKKSVPQHFIDTTESVGEKVKTEVASNRTSAYQGHSGRGGAGNWRQGDEEGERRRVEVEEMNARAKVDEQVRFDVEMGLRPPPKVHATPGYSRGDLQ